MDFFTLQRLRKMEDENLTYSDPVKLVNTNFESNNGVVVSGGNNTIHIHMHGGKMDFESENVPLQEKICNAISTIVGEGMIANKYDFAALHRILKERIYGKLGYTSFIKMINEKCSIPENIAPSDNNIKRVLFRNAKYPDWVIEEFDGGETMRLVNIATRFLELIK